MDLIINQFKTDWRHFRLLLLGLWGLFALQLPLESGLFDADAAAGIQVLSMLLQIGLGAHLIACLVQADALVGDSAQWLTRPIRRGHLFWSKTAFIVIGIMLPRLVPQLFVWTWHHYTFGLALASLGGLLLFMVAFVLFFSALAALTPNESHFFLWLGVILGAVFAWAAALSIATAHSNALPYTATRVYSGCAVAFLVFSGCALFAWIWQVLKGRGLPGKIALGLGLVALPWLLMRWPHDFLKPRERPLRPVAILPFDEANSVAEAADGQVLWSQFLATGLAPHTVLVAENVWATFTAEGQSRGQSLPSFRNSPMRALPMESGQEAAYLAAIHEFFPPETLWGARQIDNWGGFPNVESVLKKYAKGPVIGTLHARLNLDEFKVVLAERLPLKPGVWDVAPGKRVMIRSVSPKPDGVEVEIEESLATPMFSREEYLSVPTLGARSFCTYVLYQPDGGEGDVLEGNSYSYGGSDTVGGETSGTVRFLLPYPALQERLAGSTSEDFLEHASLCVFVPTYQGTVHQDLVQTNFDLSAVHSVSPSASDDLKDMELIGQTVLPASPTVAQLNDYLDAILGHLPDQASQSWRDRIQRRLEAIGSRGVPLLLARLPLDERTEREQVFPLLTKLATREQMPELRAALGRDMPLADWFHEMKWDDDARDIMVSKLGDHRVDFSAMALRMAAEAKDPATYPDLAWHFVRLQDQQAEAAEELAKCPGFDLAAAVREAWRREQLGFIPPGDLPLLAARQGLPEAFNQAVIQMEESEGGAIYVQHQALEITPLTDYSGPPENAKDWLSANLGHFRYDEARQRYVVAGQSDAR